MHRRPVYMLWHLIMYTGVYAPLFAICTPHRPCRSAAKENVFTVPKQLLSCNIAHTLKQASQCFTEVLIPILSEFGREEPP